ncbi:hypothetical protein PFICI_06344 [Pestalotiopsis fici W106-1]|uniref:Uncharacterized protein n=1 Tax=Pestalotiopsis fici (strain W106-1 / CGMCC3.15140) TaxID=1229662 RepID=W3X7I2_PESFW|nr:uncharacterized protein PFICI_06344 [Pestalotiopsis fici W106-1]ETS81342.1 hypothetical protein PFICI_06344 [Pestalotiopsis fici W106-1]
MDAMEDPRPWLIRRLLPKPEWHVGPGKLASLASCPIQQYEPIDDETPLAENDEKALRIENDLRAFVTDALENGSRRVFKIPGLSLQTRVRLVGRRKQSADRNPVLTLTVVVKMRDEIPQSRANIIMTSSYLETWRWMKSKHRDNIVLNFVRESDTSISENPDNKSRWLCDWISIPAGRNEGADGCPDSEPESPWYLDRITWRNRGPL